MSRSTLVIFTLLARGYFSLVSVSLTTPSFFYIVYFIYFLPIYIFEPGAFTPRAIPAAVK